MSSKAVNNKVSVYEDDFEEIPVMIDTIEIIENPQKINVDVVEKIDTASLLQNLAAKPKPVQDYWASNDDDGFGDDFDNIPDVEISEAGS